LQFLKNPQVLKEDSYEKVCIFIPNKQIKLWNEKLLLKWKNNNPKIILIFFIVCRNCRFYLLTLLSKSLVQSIISLLTTLGIPRVLFFLNSHFLYFNFKITFVPLRFRCREKILRMLVRAHLNKVLSRTSFCFCKYGHGMLTRGFQKFSAQTSWIGRGYIVLYYTVLYFQKVRQGALKSNKLRNSQFLTLCAS